MSMIGRINCLGKSRVPDMWRYNTHKWINRLYLIHDGEGAYIDGNERRSFVSGRLYFFPHTVDFKPEREACAGMLHTYADFELIPPIIHGRVIEFSPKREDKLTEAALSLFEVSGEHFSGKRPVCFSKISDSEEAKLAFSAITYLVSEAARSCSAKSVSDPIVLSALEVMHTSFSEKLRISDLAARSFMNVDSFIRRFDRVMGVTPYAYLKALRERNGIQ